MADVVFVMLRVPDDCEDPFGATFSVWESLDVAKASAEAQVYYDQRELEPAQRRPIVWDAEPRDHFAAYGTVAVLGEGGVGVNIAIIEIGISR